MSRHLMANNGQPTPSQRLAIRPKPLDAKGATLEDYGHAISVISIPKKARELRQILRPHNNATPTERILFRKVEKAFDQKNFQLALQKRKIEELEATVERLKPSRRRKVVPDPNGVFANINNIRQAQREVGRVESESEESEGLEESYSEDEEAEDCIVASR